MFPFSLSDYRLSGPAVFTTAAATLRQSASVVGRTPLSSSSDQVVNGASGVIPQKPDFTGRRQFSMVNRKHKAPAVIDLRSPSPESPRLPRNCDVQSFASVQKGRSSAPGRASSSKPRATEMAMVIDLRSPSPEVVLNPPHRLRSVHTSHQASETKSIGASSTSSVAMKLEEASCSGVPKRSESSTKMEVSATVLPVGDLELKPATRKRLGMGRSAVGYPNKKFKAPS